MIKILGFNFIYQIGGIRLAFNTTITFNNEENIWLILPEGDMDIYTSAEFKDQVLKNFDYKKADLLLDGESLEYIDSTGLGVLIGILKKVKENEHNIYLTNIKPNIRKLFSITELDKLFIIRGEQDE